MSKIFKIEFKGNVLIVKAVRSYINFPYKINSNSDLQRKHKISNKFYSIDLEDFESCLLHLSLNDSGARQTPFI